MYGLSGIQNIASWKRLFQFKPQKIEGLWKKKQNVVLTECYLIFESEKNEEGRVTDVSIAKM